MEGLMEWLKAELRKEGLPDDDEMAKRAIQSTIERLRREMKPRMSQEEAEEKAKEGADEIIEKLRVGGFFEGLDEEAVEERRRELYEIIFKFCTT